MFSRSTDDLQYSFCARRRVIGLAEVQVCFSPASLVASANLFFATLRSLLHLSRCVSCLMALRSSSSLLSCPSYDDNALSISLLSESARAARRRLLRAPIRSSWLTPAMWATAG